MVYAFNLLNRSSSKKWFCQTGGQTVIPYARAHTHTPDEVKVLTVKSSECLVVINVGCQSDFQQEQYFIRNWKEEEKKTKKHLSSYPLEENLSINKTIHNQLILNILSTSLILFDFTVYCCRTVMINNPTIWFQPEEDVLLFEPCCSWGFFCMLSQGISPCLRHLWLAHYGIEIYIWICLLCDNIYSSDTDSTIRQKKKKRSWNYPIEKWGKKLPGLLTNAPLELCSRMDHDLTFSH